MKTELRSSSRTALLRPVRALLSLVCTFALMFGTAQVASAAPADDGDLTAAVQEAVAAREASPTPEAWRAEAQAKERLGDYTGAQEAYRGELDALPEDAIDARRTSEADWERVRELSRGKVDDEPASTHRAELDNAWAPPVPREQLQPVPRPKADPTIDDAKDDRIITKWYFWVTVAAIAASAGAVAGIAIRAARDERSDALDASALQPMRMPTGPGVIRF